MNTTHNLMAVLLLAVGVALAAEQSQNTKDTSSKAVQVQFSPDGKLITNSTEPSVRVWDTRTGKPIPALLPPLGTWQLVSFKYGEDSKASEVTTGQKRLKHLTATHFTWVAYEVSSGKVESMAGGTYKLDGEAYTETIDYAGEGMMEYLGKKQLFTIRIDGDKLHQSGQLSDGTKIEEVWQRVR